MSFFRNKNWDASPKNIMESAETRASGEKRQASKLNVFQRGILQAVLSVALSSLFLFAGQMIFMNLYVSGFFDQGVITVFFVLASSVMMVAVTFVIMKLTMKLNIATKVTLPKVVEFSHALQNLGVYKFDEQIDFIVREKVFVFVADAAIPSPYTEDMSVKRYIFLRDKEKLKYFNGDKRLCLDAEDYERLLQKHGEHTKSAFSTRIVELEQNVTDLKAVNSLQSTDIAKLTGEKEALLAENAELRRKQQTVSSREGKAETSTIRRIPFWRVAGPLINKLIENAKPDTPYSRPDIQAAFDKELENFPGLKAPIKKELHAAKQNEPEREFDLTGWGMEAIRAALGDLAKKDPGPVKKPEKY